MTVQTSQGEVRPERMDSYNPHYARKVHKSQIPTCSILGVNIAAIDMKRLLSFLKRNIRSLSGDYINVCNVHTTVMAGRNQEYRAVQNGSLMSIPDGGPLAAVGRSRGFKSMRRTAGPSLMEEIFKISEAEGYRHFFYGSTEEILNKMKQVLTREYPGLMVAGMYSPPFRELTPAEDREITECINDCAADFVWVGLGAPKQEFWMAEHQGRIRGLMIGVGAGFPYLAGTLQRAPEWMQRHSLEWAYRLLQDPRRLFKRYLTTNFSFIWNVIILRK